MSNNEGNQESCLARNERSECSAKHDSFRNLNDSGRVATDVKKRRLDASFKQSVVEELNRLTHGEKGLYLRKMGLYASQVYLWRNEMARSKNKNLVKKTTLEQENQFLREQILKLENRNKTLEGLIELQKKMADFLERGNIQQETKEKN